MKRFLTLLGVGIAIILIMLIFWEYVAWVLLGLAAIVFSLVGIAAGLAAFVFFSKFWAQQENPAIPVKHDPNHRTAVRILVEVDENRSVVIERGGNPLRIIHGGADPKDTLTFEEWERRTSLDESDSDYFDPEKPFICVLQDVRSPILGELLYKAFRWYELYIFEATGLYAYVPLFTKPKVIPLPRYNVKPKDGRNVYTVVEEDDPGYYTNHVRTSITTWYFEYKGVDIQGIPFEITGSLQYSIDRRKVRQALYKTDAWNVLLDQSAITVIRSTVRSRASIDRVLGKVGKDIWADPRRTSRDLFDQLATEVLQNMQDFKYDVEVSRENPDGTIKLEDVGIDVHKVMFNDFEPDLSPEELLELRAPALKQRVARGIEAEGQAVARAQEFLRDVHKDGGTASELILANEALVRASEGGDIFSALLTIFAQNQQRKGGSKE